MAATPTRPVTAERFQAETVWHPTGTDHKDGANGKQPSEERTRQKILNGCWAVYERRLKIPYTQTRPSQLLNHKLPVRVAAKLIRYADCSGLVALGMDWGGVLPHVDWRYTNTWVQIRFGQPRTLKTAEPGDVVFYGPGNGNPHHEALYLGKGRVLSNGHYPMSIYPVDYRPDRIAIRSFL